MKVWGVQHGNHVWQPAIKPQPLFRPKKLWAKFNDPGIVGPRTGGVCVSSRIPAAVMHSHRREACRQICLSLECKLQETNTSGGNNVTTLAKQNTSRCPLVSGCCQHAVYAGFSMRPFGKSQAGCIAQNTIYITGGRSQDPIAESAAGEPSVNAASWLSVRLPCRSSLVSKSWLPSSNHLPIPSVQAWPLAPPPEKRSILGWG